MGATKANQARPLSFHLAVGASVMCVIAVGLILVRAMMGEPNEGTGTQPAFGEPPELLGQEGTARGLQIQVMDRDNPDRLAAEFRSATIEPRQAQRYDVTEPEATFYLENGRIVHVRAERGRMTMPDRNRQPEQGSLESNVLVRVFSEPAPDAPRFDPERDEPVLTWTGEQLSFDTTLGEASTNQPYVLVSPGYEFRGHDGKVLVNQALERLETFSTRQGGELIAFATDEEQGASPQNTPTPEPAPDTSAGVGTQADAQADATPDTTDPGLPPAPAPVPVETYYQAFALGEVRLSRAGQTIESDRLDIFARTIDNTLPEGAIASIAIQPPSSDVDPTQPDNLSDDPQDRVSDETPPPFGDADSPADQAGQQGDPVQDRPTNQPATPTEDPDPPADNHTRLVWSGPLEVNRLDIEPSTLDEDHLVARFTAEESGVVSFADQGSEASGRAATVEYGFTTQDLLLTGPSVERSVFLTSPSIGDATMGRLELSLATGIGVVPGPFSVISSDGGRLDCRERSTLRFNARDGRVTGNLREALFEGSVRATDGEASIESDQLEVYFEPDQTGVSHLRRMIAVTNVLLDDGRGYGGPCDELIVAFAPGADEPTPTSIDATDARFRDRAARVEATQLYATLRRGIRQVAGEEAQAVEDASPTGGLEVVKTWASGDVRFERFADQVEIRGESLFADLDAQILEVDHEGGRARVAQGGTVIEGESVNLNGLERTVIVSGPGMFEHQSGRGETGSHIRAEWTQGMAFDDISGRLDAAGSISAVSHPDPHTREWIEGERLLVELEPRSEVGELVLDEQDQDTERLDLAGDDRKILRVVASTMVDPDAPLVDPGADQTLATIESARFDSPLPDWNDQPDEQSEMPALERAFRISGVEIISETAAGTLEVPGRGRLFVADLRAAPEGLQTPEDRGAALFDWTGALRADRDAGIAELTESVQMSHNRLADGARVVLESQRLTVRFAPGDAAEPENLFGGLRSAVAQDQVYLRNDSRELTGDVVEYNPETGIARALADRNVPNAFGEVRVLDRTSAVPLFARAVIWDMTTDQIDVVDPSSVVIPR